MLDHAHGEDDVERTAAERQTVVSRP